MYAIDDVQRKLIGEAWHSPHMRQRATGQIRRRWPKRDKSVSARQRRIAKKARRRELKAYPDNLTRRQLRALGDVGRDDVLHD